MAFDGIFLALQIKEILSAAKGCRVDKIHQPSRDELVLHLRGRGFTGRLLICARPGTSRMGFTENPAANPAVPPMLCMLLRKKLVGAALLDINQISLDRIVLLKFSGINELGDPCVHYLAAELTGARPNIILLDENKNIIDALRRSSAEGPRLIMPGAAYEPPPAPRRMNIFTDSVDEIAEEISRRDGDLHDKILSTLEGVSPLICRELAFLVQSRTGQDAPRLALNEILQNFIFSIKNTGPVPTIIMKDGLPFEYSYMPIKQYPAAESRKFESLSKLLDEFYFERDKALRHQSMSRELGRAVSTAQARVAKKINLRRGELEKCAGREEFRIFGELIKANIHLINRGDKSCRVPNYYDPNCAEVNIPLDEALSPAENAQKYFKLYKKASTAHQLLRGLIEDGEQELAYIKTVGEALSRAETEREIAEIREELTGAGYLRKRERKPAKKQSLLPPKSYESPDGYTILVGRNNRQNDQLTSKTAGPRDLWFHARNVPGSHVVILCGGLPEPPEATIKMAAELAARNSSIREKHTGEVDYTFIKYVKKIPGAGPGMVIYDKFKTIYVKFP